MSRAIGTEVPGWADPFDHAEFCGQVAACHLLLGRHDEADRWADCFPVSRATAADRQPERQTQHHF
jgi:hypothetical protein